MRRSPGAPVRTLDNAAQVHPVVARLCAPIEGTDAARLADCLGLDAARFHAAAAAAAGAGARGAADDALLGAAASLDDDARYSVRGRRLKPVYMCSSFHVPVCGQRSRAAS